MPGEVLLLDNDDITVFKNNSDAGLQFAAVALGLYELARAAA